MAHEMRSEERAGRRTSFRGSEARDVMAAIERRISTKWVRDGPVKMYELALVSR